ncbi:hypothetical protein [Roseovarius sp.]|uniref:hypothetical protein n=1 Tax=Roseovarius sp. TaxID=1486281 RepID=UPI003B5AAFCF
MSALRDEIRAILREEIAALRNEAGGMAPAREQVRIASGADLTRFAQELVQRAAEPGFADRVARGELVFDLATPMASAAPAAAAPPIVTGPRRAAPDRLDKSLITERDINALSASARSLRIAPSSRLTPLARDEARRRGIRIERDKT